MRTTLALGYAVGSIHYRAWGGRGGKGERVNMVDVQNGIDLFSGML